MSAQQILSHFLHILSVWEQALREYSLDQLLDKPSEESWSLGQVYTHLLDGTRYFHLQHIEQCLSSPENAGHPLHERTAQLLAANAFPPTEIKRRAGSKNDPDQPATKEDLAEKIAFLKMEVARVAPLIDEAPWSGKTLHGILGYLDAVQWFQLAEMHFRHHLRQKEKLDTYLEIT